MYRGNAINAGGSDLNTMRACSTSGCRVSKYVEVTKRKCSQFVTAPYIMTKPLVVNGKTSIFQVGGDMAKMNDIPTLSSTNNYGNGQPVYRIKPGTHAHVINYVFIEEGSDSMEKAKSEDQEAMRMLLDSQRESATAKLQKLITAHRSIPQTSAARGNTTMSTRITAPPRSTVHVTTPQIHPNLSIASVEGARPTTAVGALSSKLAMFGQNDTKEQSVDQLHAEILKLRRTVCSLASSARR